MADSTISGLPGAVTVTPNDVLPVDQGGVTKKVTIGSLAVLLNTTSGTSNLLGGAAGQVPYQSAPSVTVFSPNLTFDGNNLSVSGTLTAAGVVPTGTSVPTNGMFLPATNTVAWSTASTERMRVDASGNVNIGTSGQSWLAAAKAITLPNTATYEYNSGLYLSQNTYLNGSSQNIYRTTAAASAYALTAGTHVWYVAPSGTAGAAATYINAMTLDNLGNLSLAYSQNSSYIAQLTNNSAGASAQTTFVAGNGTYTANFGILGTGFGTSGLYVPNALYVLNTGNTPNVYTTNFGVHQWSVDNGATAAMTLSSFGNLGINTSPSSWSNSTRAVENAAGALAAYTTTQQLLTQNAYYNGSGVWTYKTSAQASYYQQQLGTHTLYVAPSGTAGAAITWTAGLSVDNTGNLSVAGTGTQTVGGASSNVVVQTLNVASGNINNLSGSLSLSTSGGGNLTVNAGGTSLSNLTVSGSITGTGLTAAFASPPAIGGTTPAAGTFTSMNGGQLAGLRNRIINGDMRIDQRNSGAAVTPAAPTYILDRWQIYAATAAITYQQTADAPAGLKYSIKATLAATRVTSASDAYSLVQNIEGQNIVDFQLGAASAATVTLSFWVKSSVPGTYAGSLRNGATNRSYLFTFPVTSSWVKQSVSLTMDTAGTWATDNTSGLSVWFDLGSGSNYQNATTSSWLSGNYVRTITSANFANGTNGATFNLAGVQLELGSVATPFETRPIGMELSLCQRYYAQGSSGLIGTQVGTVTVGRATCKLPVTMRASPSLALANTVTFFNGTVSTAATGTIIQWANLDYWQADVTVGSIASTSGLCCLMVTNSGVWTASAEL
jgi:hypothetical protein